MDDKQVLGQRVKFTVSDFWIGAVEGVVVKQYKNGKVAVKVDRPHKVFHVKYSETTPV
jgi:hypothetical protein